MNLVYELRVYGQPGPQGSKRHLGGGVMVEMSRKVKPWRQGVRSDAIDQRGARPPLDEPLLVEMVFTAYRPKSHYRTGRNSALLRPTAPARPTAPPDLSKLARSTEDAITESGIWRDDALVVEYLRLAKVFALEDPDALDAPGAVIRIYTLGAPA